MERYHFVVGLYLKSFPVYHRSPSPLLPLLFQIVGRPPGYDVDPLWKEYEGYFKMGTFGNFNAAVPTEYFRIFRDIISAEPSANI